MVAEEEEVETQTRQQSSREGQGTSLTTASRVAEVGTVVILCRLRSVITVKNFWCRDN